jgi:integrase
MRERRPGVWGLEVYLGKDPVTGRKRYRTETFHGRKRQAETALAQLIARTNVERAPETEGTFAYLLEEWMRIVKRDRSPTTHQEYRRIIDSVIVPRLGAIELRALTARDLDALYHAETDRGLSANSVGQVHAICRRALNVAVKWDWIETNPAHKATPPARTKAEIHPPVLQTYFDMLEAADALDRDFGVLVRVAAATGCRRGELCGLQWRDLDVATGRLAVRRSVAVVKGATPGQRDIVVKDTKSHQTRTLTLDVPTLELLAEHLEHCIAWAQRDAAGLVPAAFMFSHDPDRARPLRPPWVTETFGRARELAGMGHIWLHGLRHLNGSLQLAAGVPLATVSARLGHLYQSTTLGFYSHSMPGADGDAAAKLGALLARPLAAPAAAQAAS